MKKKTGIVLAILSPMFVSFIGNNTNTTFAEPIINSSLKVSLNVSPTDPFYTGESVVPTSWTSKGYCYENIQMDHIGDIEKVWDKYTGKGVVLAVIDSGIDTTSPDFIGHLHEKSASIKSTSQGIEINVGIDYAMHTISMSGGCEDHGSSTAGVAAAQMNDYGIVGVAPDATILAIKSDLSVESVNESIKYAADCGADIINMSLGTYAEPYFNEREQKWHKRKNFDYIPGYEEYMQEVIDYAYEKGCIIVASAGNESTETHSFPAANKHVIGVGALHFDSEEYLAGFSNFNKDDEKATDNVNVDLVAPGYVISDGYDGRSGSQILLTQGTSFSAPIVAGAAALWKEQNPEGTLEEFENDLYSSCESDVPFSKLGGHGILNVANLVTPLKLKNTSLSVAVNSKAQIEVLNVDTSKVTFESPHPEIATVDENGKITTHGVGEINIYVTYDNDTRMLNLKVNPQTVGCGGSIAAVSITISVVSLAFISLILIKKRFAK